MKSLDKCIIKLLIFKINSKNYVRMNRLFKTNYQFIRYVVLLVLVMLSINIGGIYAQDGKTITGKVTDNNNEPLPFVNVLIKGQTQGTTTDENGSYSINVPNTNSVLQFSFVGYITSEVTVGNQTTINVTLEGEANNLDEVVVVGYTTQRRESLTGALTTIDSKKLQDITAPSTANLLAGKATGVFAVQSSGRPGTPADVVIRGKTTINGSVAPLWVIDGVIVGNNANEFNPNDIETITVLKDAASTAIYGSSGSNGVIVITTKKAKLGTSSINFSGRIGVNKLTLGNLSLMNGSQLYNYFNTFENKSELGNKFNDGLSKRNFDWFDNATQLGKTQDYSLSMTGGTDKFKTYVSLGYYDEEGAVKGYDYTRLSGRMNVDYSLNKYINIKPSVAISRIDTYSQEHSIGAMYTNLPWDSPFSSDDGHILSNTELKSAWFNTTATNYMYDLQWNYSKTRAYDIMAGFDFDVKITNYLTFSSMNNYKFNNYKTLTYTDPRSSAGENDNGSIYNYRSDYYRLFTNQMIRFTKSFGDHFISALAAYEFNEYESNWNSATKGSILPGLTVQDAASQPKSIAGNGSAWAVQSYFFNSNYSYSNRYLAQLSLRRDGASNFGKNKKYGNFFSISGGWNIHNESFYSLNNIINVLKLRASYGSTGNRPNALYPHYGLYSVTGSYDGIPSAVISQLPNADLSWEKTYTAGIGFDLRFIDRIGLTIDLYDKNTSDLLQAVPLPAVVGVTSIWQNIGSVNNKGLEVTITADIIRTKDLQWTLSANLGINKNKVTKLNAGKQIAIGDGSNIAGSAEKLLKEGLDMDSWYLREWAGVDPETGNPLWYKTVSGKRVTTGNRSEADQVVLGSAAPKMVGGFNTDINYKGISLSAVFNYVIGGKIYNYLRTELDSDGTYTDRNQMNLMDGWKRWEKPGDIATHPRPLVNGNNSAQAVSSRYLENGSYLRMRNITLGYNIPKSLTKYFSMNVYISGENLLTFTNFSGIDPEVGLNRVSGFNYPITKRYMFGINVNF